jgi:hypothetical protein
MQHNPLSVFQILQSQQSDTTLHFHLGRSSSLRSLPQYLKSEKEAFAKKKVKEYQTILTLVVKITN